MSIERSLPLVFVNRTDQEDIEDDVSATRGLTSDERGQIMVALCRLAAEQIAQHVDPQKVLDWKDPISAETEMALAQLRQRWKHHV